MSRPRRSDPSGQYPDLIAVLAETKTRRGLKRGEWLVGYGYDGTTLAEGRELTRDDLDPHFPENPVWSCMCHCTARC